MNPQSIRPTLSSPPSVSLPQDEIDALRIDAFERLLALFPPGRLVDLGAGHGKIAIRAARLGWDVVAIDARDERFPKTDAATFVVADVRDVDLAGYDLVVCLGLFYHLTLDDQRSLLARCAGRPLILDTHVAVGESRLEELLSDVVEVDGLAGRMFQEGTDARSSWINTHAFWPTPDSLGQMLRSAGYGVVLEADPWVMSDRRFYVALPVGYAFPAVGVRRQATAFARSVRFRLSRAFRAAQRAEV